MSILAGQLDSFMQVRIIFRMLSVYIFRKIVGIALVLLLVRLYSVDKAFGLRLVSILCICERLASGSV